MQLKVLFQPCFYHDISLEIPLDFQKVVRYLYYLWMIYCASLAVNVLGNMTFWIVASKQEEDSDAKANAPKVSFIKFKQKFLLFKDFALSILWLGLFSPCSMCWYIPAYRAFKTDSSFNFFIFFFIFFFQVFNQFFLSYIKLPKGKQGFMQRSYYTNL